MGGHWPLSLPSVVITSQIVLMMMMPAIRRRKGSCLLFVNLFCINVYLSCISELLCTNTSVECRTGNTKKCCYYVLCYFDLASVSLPLPVCASAVLSYCTN